MATLFITSDDYEVLHPSELGLELHLTDVLPAATEEPQFVGFRCIACGKRHADLAVLLECGNTPRLVMPADVMMHLVTA